MFRPSCRIRRAPTRSSRPLSRRFRRCTIREIPVNIWELGLIYDVVVDAAGVAGIRMTLTAPGCPAAQSLPVEVAEKVRKVPGVADAKVEVVWEPGWTKDRMSEAAKLQLGLW